MIPEDNRNWYDENYFRTSCGSPYGRSPEWLQLFDGIAEAIVRKIQPRTVLDVGCAMGFLVEKLRERGIDASGLDVSEYALGKVREDLQAFCRSGSVLDPLPGKYDLIVCIEVLEHLSAKDCDGAVRNLCAASDDIVFSSTPVDYREATHLNVQPPNYWAGLFASYGFVRDVDFDASFITPWAARFRRNGEPLARLVQNYERRFWQLWEENQELRRLTLEMRGELSAAKKELRAERQPDTQEPRSTSVRVEERSPCPTGKWAQTVGHLRSWFTNRPG